MRQSLHTLQVRLLRTGGIWNRPFPGGGFHGGRVETDILIRVIANAPRYRQEDCD
jgi:hypothetical protein